MWSGLPEQELAAALETSGGKAAAAAAAVSSALVPVGQQCSSQLGSPQRVEGTWRRQERGSGERPRKSKKWRPGLMLPAMQEWSLITASLAEWNPVWSSSPCHHHWLYYQHQYTSNTITVFTSNNGITSTLNISTTNTTSTVITSITAMTATSSSSPVSSAATSLPLSHWYCQYHQRCYHLLSHQCWHPIILSLSPLQWRHLHLYHCQSHQHQHQHHHPTITITTSTWLISPSAMPSPLSSSAALQYGLYYHNDFSCLCHNPHSLCQNKSHFFEEHSCSPLHHQTFCWSTVTCLGQTTCPDLGHDLKVQAV